MRHLFLATGLYAALGAVSCGEALQEDTQIGAAQVSLVTWAQCADQGGFCAFSGSVRVRYSANGKSYEISATGGVQCSPKTFGVPREAWGNDKTAHCELAQTSAATSDGQAGGAAPSDMHALHAAGAGAPSSAGLPRVDPSAIPAGSPGVNHPMLQSTTERPAPSDGTGAFRTVCDYSHMNFDDPIVYPGQPGKAHLHAYFGNTGSNASSTASTLATTGNSTCRGGTINRSGYWAPALIDAAGKPQKPLSLEVYYKSGYGGVAANAIRPFPGGLRMIAGDMRASSAQWNAYWGCREHYVGRPGSIPRCNAGENVAMIVEFPQCWDGKNLDSPDHKSHMAYPQDSGCPATHPVAIPAITMNVIYKNPGTAALRLSSDMYDSSLPGGFSAHADWFGGWDPAIVNTFVTKCINPALDCHSHLLGDGREML